MQPPDVWGVEMAGKNQTRATAARLGFTLVELLVIIGIVVLLFTILLPVLGRVQDQAARLKCANNLHQLGMTMLIYSADEPNGGFPRTLYDPGKKQLQLDNAGYMVPNTFGHSGYVGENNVPASLFLLLKTRKVSPLLFICPSTDATPGYVGEHPELSSNWESIPQNMTYSLAAPFPSAAAAKAGFLWKNSMNPQFAIAADINPGTRGGTDTPNNVVGPHHDDPDFKLAAANSNNHKNKGQNVLYADGHVEFQTTPYCGAMRPGGTYDNIYTAGIGDAGATGDKAMPVDKYDSVLFPTDDPGGK